VVTVDFATKARPAFRLRANMQRWKRWYDAVFFDTRQHGGRSRARRREPAGLPRRLVLDRQSFGSVMGKDKSSSGKKITGTMKDIANIAGGSRTIMPMKSK